MCKISLNICPVSVCVLLLSVYSFACVWHGNTSFVWSPFPLMCLCDCVRAEWIEEHSSAAAPLANYAPNHLETYRDPQVPPTLPPGPAGVKRKSPSLLLLDFFSFCHVSWYRPKIYHKIQHKWSDLDFVYSKMFSFLKAKVWSWS